MFQHSTFQFNNCQTAFLKRPAVGAFQHNAFQFSSFQTGYFEQTSLPVEPPSRLDVDFYATANQFILSDSDYRPRLLPKYGDGTYLMHRIARLTKKH